MNLNHLLSKLTLDEKIGQLVMIPPFYFLKKSAVEVAGPLRELGIEEKDIYNVGSILGIGNAEEMITIQKDYLANSRHKIPLIFMADIIHGYETIFPVPLGLSTSFNDDILAKVARISAKEASTAGIGVTFAPMVDLVRDPRWGRVVESFGEDPYLTKRFAEVQVNAYQGNNVKDNGNLASCVKHFAAYGLVEGGRDYNTVDLSRLNLFQNYLSGFKGAINAGCKMVMTSFNLFEGIPATINQYLLKDVLRGSLNFKGVIISDYASLKETITHGVKENEYEAAKSGVKAGLNIEMATALYLKNLTQAVKKGDLKEELIDELVLDVLKLKKSLGLFENPYKDADPKKEKMIVRSKNHLNEALLAAQESIVLLKNEKVFPINQKQKISLIGKYSNNPFINGPWSWHGSKHHNDSLLDVFKKDFNLIYHANEVNINYDKLNESDVILIALGENENESGEAHSKTNLKLPNQQEDFIKDIKNKTNKPIGLIIFSGRPLDLSNIVNLVDGIFLAFFPGTMGAKALANLISGKSNPSAKLTMSFPRDVGQIPVYYNYLNTGRPYHKNDQYTSYYLDLENQPLYPFGYGLSYSKYKYTNFRISKNKINLSESLTVFVDITNDSEVKGKEVVQLYLKDHFAEVSRPVKELINFTKLEIAPYETKTVEFKVDKFDLSYIGTNLKPKIDPGKFSLMVGPNSVDLLEIQFDLI